MDNQNLLISVESMLDIHPLENFNILFSNLKDHHLDLDNHIGRKPFSRRSLLRALILKNLKSVSTLSELKNTLNDNPSAAHRCGFDISKPIPTVERFSAFLRDTDNKNLQKIRIDLVHKLINLKIISGKYLSIDSCAILAKVKENNLKTNVKDRFNKHRICKGDPEAKLGVMITFSKSIKEISYFWGYRDHVVIDAQAELPVWNITKPANVQDSVMFIPIFDLIQKEFNFTISAVLADGIYDTAAILKHVINTLKSKPRIAQNPRNTESFKKDFNLRTGSERVFSRLLSICMQDPPVVGLKATANYVTIAHISVLLVAVTAAKNNVTDKVRFIKSFLPNFVP